MTEITRVAIDTSKSVFTLHAVDGRDRPVLRRNLRRQDLVSFFAKLPPVDVAMEACGGSHYWGRTLQAMGHRVRLIPAQYVKPFVKRSKNDRNDAQAISEAAARPGMQEVAVKSADAQARAMLLTVRELLVRQRTQLVNALRGHATEMGLVAPVGDKGLAALRSEIEADATVNGAGVDRAGAACAVLHNEVADHLHRGTVLGIYSTAVIAGHVAFDHVVLDKPVATIHADGSAIASPVVRDDVIDQLRNRT